MKTVNVDHCADVSRQVSGVLDVEDPITEAYQLEVFYLGWDRLLYALKHYQSVVGSETVSSCASLEGRRNFKGPLVAVENDEDVVIRVDQEEFVLPFEAIEQGRCAPKG